MPARLTTLTLLLQGVNNTPEVRETKTKHCISYTPAWPFYRATLCCHRVSVSPSVTSQCSTKMAKPRITQTTLHDSPGTLHCGSKNRTHVTSSNRCTEYDPLLIIFGLVNLQRLFSLQLSNWRVLMKVDTSFVYFHCSHLQPTTLK